MFKKVLLVLIFSPFILQAQDCIDSTAIDPGCICLLNYDPVCGCDGELYSNPCEATQCFGVTSYVSAYDTNGNIIDCSTLATDNSICDSINVEVESFNLMTENGEVTLTINMSTFFTSSEFFGYAGFVLLNLEEMKLLRKVWTLEMCMVLVLTTVTREHYILKNFLVFHLKEPCCFTKDFLLETLSLFVHFLSALA